MLDAALGLRGPSGQAAGQAAGCVQRHPALRRAHAVCGQDQQQWPSGQEALGPGVVTYVNGGG